MNEKVWFDLLVFNSIFSTNRLHQNQIKIKSKHICKAP